MTKEYKGFLDIAIKLGANPVDGKDTVTSKETYKIGDNYISVGDEPSYGWTYPEGASTDVIHDINIAMNAYARAAMAHSISEQKQAKGISASVAPEGVDPDTGYITPPAPPSAPPSAPSVAATPPVAVSTQISADPTYVVLKNPHIARTDDNRAKIFGQTEEYKWTLWGVNIYHEVIDAAAGNAPTLENWREWPQCKGTATGFPEENRYQLPDGLQEAVVLMKLDDGKWKPDKVVELR